MNNNNFGRSNIPSNINYNNQLNGNPMNNFLPTSSNNPIFSNSNTQQNNYNKAFKQNNQFIAPINYQNQNNLLHNNVGERVLDENIIEYRINVDSADRDTSYYKDPFTYTIKFNPVSSQTIQGVNYSGTPAPHIVRDFRNVKYIKLESIVLPRYQFIENVSDDNFELQNSSASHLFDDRFVIMEIDELKSAESRVYGTNVHLTNSFSCIIPDKLISTYFYTGLPYLGNRYYKDNNLQNINKLTIRFKDSYGNPIKIKEVSGDTVVNTDPLAIKQEDGTYELDGETIEITDVRHPLNEAHQHHFSLVIGVIEADINTNVKYFK